MIGKTKILFVSSRVPFPVRDGHSRRTYNILKGLAQTNDVYFLSLYEKGEELNAGTRRHFEQFCSGIECIPAPSKSLGFSMVVRLLRSVVSVQPYTIWRHYSPDLKKRVRELIHTREFDLIHCDILPLAYAVPRKSPIPCTLTDHDVCSVKALRIAGQSKNLLIKSFFYLESLKLRLLESGIFKRVSLGIAVSELDKRQLQELCPEGNFAVVENGVDTREFAPAGEDPVSPSLVWVGGFGYSPNREAIDYFLREIYPQIQKEIPGVRFSIVGSGTTEILKSRGSRDASLNILGYVENPALHLQKAMVFVVPILSGSGTRLKTLEAMAAGKAIVTTSIGCEGIEGVDKEHYLVADTPRDFAASVVSLLKNGIMRKQLGRNARNLAVQKYEWETIFEKMNLFYRRLHDASLPAGGLQASGSAAKGTGALERM